MKQQDNFVRELPAAVDAMEQCPALAEALPEETKRRCLAVRDKILAHRDGGAPFRIVFCGVFSAGKTSLINALLKSDYALPTGIVPITKVVTHIRYGRELACSYMRDGKQNSLNADDALKLIQGKMPVPGGGTEIFVRLPSPILMGDVELLDTPGFEDEMGGELEYMSRKALAEADMAVVCCSALQLGKMFERSLLADLDRSIGNYCMAVTRMDSLNTAEEREDIRRKAAWLMRGRGDLAMLQKDPGRFFLTVCGGRDPALDGFDRYLKRVLDSEGARERIRASTDRLGAAACAADLWGAAEETGISEGSGPAESRFKQKLELLLEGAAHYCPQCGRRLDEKRVICPACGKLHPVKVKDMNRKTKEILSVLSQLAARDSTDYSICWDMEARKISQIISKTESLAVTAELPGLTGSLKKDLENLLAQCRTPEFQIAVVGVMKAGKSMLMNALMGAEIASVDINPETAALTMFRSGSGFSIKVKFHNREEWEKLCESARRSEGSALSKVIGRREVRELAEKWLGHKTLTKRYETIGGLRQDVAHWTSARSCDHLFAAEVEVGIDRGLFDMPSEVVFVDTPGLHDPVQYRSDITKRFIRKANAVLIAVPTRSLTAEGLGTITTVLDYVGTNKEKAYIIATQKDTLNSGRETRKVIDGWVEHLVAAKRYADEAEANAHIIVTTAYMSLLLNRFTGLTDEELDDPERFSDDEYTSLETYAKKTLGSRRYRLENLREDGENVKKLEEDSGIPALRACLAQKLLTKYRTLKMQDIRDEYIRCRSELLSIAGKARGNQEEILWAARQGSGEMKKRLEESRRAYEEAKLRNAEIRRAAEEVRGITDSLIQNL